MSSMGDSYLICDVLRAHFGDNGGRMHTAAEIGCHRGETSAKILRAFPSLMLWLVDSYRSHLPKKRFEEQSDGSKIEVADDGDDYYKSGDSLSRLTRGQQHQHYLAAVANTDFAKHRRMFVKFPSVAAAQIISTPRLSWVFLDGDHSLSGVRADIAAWWPKVEARGLLCGHDYGHVRDGKQFGVKQAVTEFAEREKLEVGLLGSCWFVVKK